MPDEGDEPAVFVTAGSGSRFAREVEKWRLAERRGLDGSWCEDGVEFCNCWDELKRD